MNSGLTSHQQRGHTETGPRFKVSSERPEKRGIDLATPFEKGGKNEIGGTGSTKMHPTNEIILPSDISNPLPATDLIYRTVI